MPLLSQSEKEIRRMRGSMSVGVADSQPGRKDMSDGQQQLAVIDGTVTDVKKVNGELYHNRIFKSFEEESDAVLNEETVVKVQHKFTGNPVFDPGFQSDTFSSGFAGSGYRINKDTASDFSSPNTAYNIEIDNMIVRGTLSVYELLIQQIRATNGAIFVTSAAKVASASGLSASDDVGTITFDDPSGKSLCPFADGDIIMMQRVDPGSTVSQSAAGDASGVVKKLVYLINGSPSGATVTVENAGFNNLSYPVEGDEFVRIGNDGTTANRDGVIYLTSDDSNAPFIDIKSSINAYSEWYGNVPKVRLGNLAGITYDSASLSGYGLYSENVYLTGKMTATSGYIGNGSSGFTINSAYIGNGKASLTDSNSGVYVGTDGISLGASSVFKVTNAGALTATSATITGAITATSGSFAGSLSVGAGDNILRVDTDGDLWIGNATQGSAPFQVTKAGAVTASNMTISGGSLSVGSSNSIFRVDTDGDMWIGNATQGSAPFQVTKDGAVTASNLSVTGGSLSVGSSNSIFRVDTDGDMWIGNATQGSAPFQVTKDGVLTATSGSFTGTLTSTAGTFGGWTINGNGMYRGTAVASGSYTGSASDITIGAGWISANKFRVDSDGTAHFKGTLDAATGGSLSGSTCSITNLVASNITAAGTITGSTFQTASSGQRIAMSHSDNTLRFYDGGAEVITIDDDITTDYLGADIPGMKIINGSIHLYDASDASNKYVKITDENSYFVGKDVGGTLGVISVHHVGSHDLGKVCIKSDISGASGSGTKYTFYGVGGRAYLSNSFFDGQKFVADAGEGLESASGGAKIVTGGGGGTFAAYAGGSGNDCFQVYNHTPTVRFTIKNDGAIYQDTSELHAASDENKKKDIVTIDNCLDKVTQLRPVSFKWKAEDANNNTHFGLIAQEVQPIIPEIVNEWIIPAVEASDAVLDEEGSVRAPAREAEDEKSNGLTLVYSELIPYLIGAVKELKAEVEELKSNG